MSEVHVSIKSDSSGNALKFDNPGVAPLAPSSGKAVTVTAGTGTHGTVNNGTTNAPQIVFDNPAYPPYHPKRSLMTEQERIDAAIHIFIVDRRHFDYEETERNADLIGDGWSVKD